MPQEMIAAVEEEILKAIQSLNKKITHNYFEMVDYQFGISKRQKYIKNRGKMLRPLILLLCSTNTNSHITWKNAVPAAAAVELLHNFSLVHDDIQDNSPTRRNRPTVWKEWGIPQAINAGDGLFSMANISIGNLSTHFEGELVVQIMKVFNKTCLDLTRGQFMDIAFEEIENISLEQYWTMIEYKTARLISASAEIGAILSGNENEVIMDFRKFGLNLGLAYQIEDDILGIWGSEGKTGKSVTMDLETSKKTLPVVYGLNNSPKFAKRWYKGNITKEESISLSNQLKIDGALEYSQNHVINLTDKALIILNKLPLPANYKQVLFDLSTSLLDRET